MSWQGEGLGRHLQWKLQLMLAPKKRLKSLKIMLRTF